MLCASSLSQEAAIEALCAAEIAVKACGINIRRAISWCVASESV